MCLFGNEPTPLPFSPIAGMSRATAGSTQGPVPLLAKVCLNQPGTGLSFGQEGLLSSRTRLMFTEVWAVSSSVSLLLWTVRVTRLPSFGSARGGTGGRMSLQIRHHLWRSCLESVVETRQAHPRWELGLASTPLPGAGLAQSGGWLFPGLGEAWRAV